MVFYYKSTSTDYNNSGTIAVSVNYNATEFKYSSIEQVLNSMFAVASKPSESFAAPVECDPESMPDGGYYVRHESAVQTTTDLRMSTIGTVQFVTEGLTLPPGTVVGQLWCTYDVELLFPYITPSNVFAPTVWTTESYCRLADNTLGDPYYVSTTHPFDFSSTGTGFSQNFVMSISNRTEPGRYNVKVLTTWTDFPGSIGAYVGTTEQTGTSAGRFTLSSTGGLTFTSSNEVLGAEITTGTAPNKYDVNIRSVIIDVPEGLQNGAIYNLLPRSMSRQGTGPTNTVYGNVTVTVTKI
jgi:hypothetical protein